MKKELHKEICEKCIGYLLDKTEGEGDRVAAAENLMFCAGQKAKDALFDVIQDKEDLDCVRKAAAGALGRLWSETDIEYERLIQIEPTLLDGIVFEFDSYKLILQKEKLGKALEMFKERYGKRPFLA